MYKTIEKKDLIDISLLIGSILILFVTIFPFYNLCQYNHPSDDDNFGIFTTERANPTEFSLKKIFTPRGTAIPATKFLYNGVFESSMTKTMENILNVYHIGAVVYLSLFLFSLTFLFFAFNKCFFKFSKIKFLFFLSLFLYLSFNAIYYPVCTFYDMVNATSYMLGFASCAFFLSFLILEYKTHLLRYKVLFCVFMIFSNYSLEIYPFVNGFILFYFIILNFIKNKKINFYYSLLLLACIGIFLQYLIVNIKYITPDSSGNIGKYKFITIDENVSSSQNLISNVIAFIKSFIGFSSFYFFTYLCDKVYLFVLVIFSFCISHIFYKRQLKLKVLPVLPLFVIPAGISFIFYLAIPGVFYMRRYVWTISFILIFLYIYLLVSFINHFEFKLFGFIEKNDKALCIEKAINFIASCVSKKIILTFASFVIFYFCFFSIFSTHTVVAEAWRDIRTGFAQTYDKELKERYSQIINSNDEVVFVKPLTVAPYCLVYFEVLFHDERTSKRYSKFFNKETVYLTEENRIIKF